MSGVKDSLFNQFEGSLLGELCSAMLVNGLSELGRKVRVSFCLSESVVSVRVVLHRNPGSPN
jgi:hypothetical protein